MPTIAPYGSWTSPLTARLLTEAGIQLGGAWMMGDDLYWTEGRPTEGGRVALVRKDSEGTATDVTPPGFNARTRAHEYGGGAIGLHDGTILACQFEDQRVYRLDGAEATAITPEPELPGGARYADFAFHGDLVICVREMHQSEGEPVTDLVVFPVDGSSPPQRVFSGHDFYASPRVSPDGSQLAWLTWDHPRMPWDGSELHVADLAPDGTLSHAEVVAGGPQESIFQPEWSPQGELVYISDRTGWWNLYRRDSEGNDGTDHALYPADLDFGAPQWVFGMQRFAFLEDGRIVVIYNEDGWHRLGVLEAGALRTVELAQTDLASSLSVHEGKVWLVGSGPSSPSAVLAIDLDTGAVDVAKEAMSLDLDPTLVSEPEPIFFPTTDDGVAHAFYYPPHNPDFEAPEDQRPPLIVMSHGGPTGFATAGFNLAKQYWTTRGFAVVDVNYRGSTGFGRAYRNALQGTWGVVDTDDCIAAANFLANRGDIDSRRMAIRGGSAGGYTTLCALTFHEVFAVGASYFGVADLAALAQDTHKFESRYLDGLIGPYPEAEDLYRERSPAHHTEHLRAPMLILQGLDDKVVLPNQAEAMVEALQENGIPYSYVAFEGEGHGFRAADNQVIALESELSFYSWAFGFEPADDLPYLAIENERSDIT